MLCYVINYHYCLFVLYCTFTMLNCTNVLNNLQHTTQNVIDISLLFSVTFVLKFYVQKKKTLKT